MSDVMTLATARMNKEAEEARLARVKLEKDYELLKRHADALADAVEAKDELLSVYSGCTGDISLGSYDDRDLDEIIRKGWDHSALTAYRPDISEGGS